LAQAGGTLSIEEYLRRQIASKEFLMPSLGFKSYYSSLDVDVLRENYERVLAVFDVNATATQEALLSQAVCSVSIPQVFMILAVSHQNMPRVYTLHRPSRITAPLGVSSPWDGQIFATNGDIQGN